MSRAAISFLTVCVFLVGGYFLFPLVSEKNNSPDLLNDFVVRSNGAVTIDPKKLTLLVVFSPYDCARCLREVMAWKHLQGLFGERVAIVGLIRCREILEVKRFAEVNDVQFPLVLDSTDQLAEKFLGNEMIPMRFFFHKSALLRADKVGVEFGSKEERALIDWITDELSKEN